MIQTVSKKGVKLTQTESEEKTVWRKNLPEYEGNPSIPVASQNAKIGTRRITNKAGDKCMIVSEHGEIVAPAGFHEVIEVDRTQFVKLYVGGVAAFNDLSSPGAKVFKLVYNYIVKNPNTDQINLHHKKAGSMGKATFDRGLTELLAKEILYKSTIPNLFFLNVNYIFNGDRLALVKEYRMKTEILGEVQEPLPL